MALVGTWISRQVDITSLHTIQIWSAFLYPHIGGYEKNVWETARRLSARGFVVRIITCRSDNKSPVVENKDGVEVVRLACIRILNGTYPIPLPTSQLLRLLVSGKPVIDITQTRFFVTSLLGYVHSVLHNNKLIHVERGSRHSAVANPLVNVISQVYDHTMGRLILSRATCVIGVSDAACRFTIHIGAKRPIRIPNGISKSETPTDISTRNQPIILFVGRLIEAKGVQDLITAFCSVKWLSNTHQLAIVGDGPYRKKLQEIARTTGNENIVFHGEMTGPDLLAIYRFARVLVNPSYSEGLPTSVMEAAANGVPVLATDVGGTKEMIEDGVTGMLVEPHNIELLATKLNEMALNTDVAIDMARRCQANILANYSWEETIDKYCAILKNGIQK